MRLYYCCLFVAAGALGTSRAHGEEGFQVDAGDDGNVLAATAWNVYPLTASQEEEDDVLLLRGTGNKKGSRKGEAQVSSDVLGEYPEVDLLKDKELSAVCLSGGGTRAYLSSLGYLRGLLDLHLLNNTRYLSSVSGGSWINAAYSYFQESAVGMNEMEWLGEIVDPEKLDSKTLKKLDKRSARASPVNKDVLQIIIWKLIRGVNPAEIWQETIAEVFLEPAGIPADAQVAWNKELLKEATSRNPTLKNENFIFPCQGKETGCKNKPFPVLNAAMLGPKLAAPFDTKDDNYVPMEFNPYFIGSAKHHKLQYTSKGLDGKTKLLNLTVGGLVETFAFGGVVSASNEDPTELSKPFFGMGPNNYTAILSNVPLPQNQFGIANATATSSFAPGSILSSSPLLRELDNRMGLAANYWSPVTNKPTDPIFSTPVFMADGASLENNGFLSILRRRLKEIVVFINSPVPLRPRSVFDPFKRAATPVDVDVALSSLFGIDHEAETVVENLFHNQAFPRYAFPTLVDKLQKAQQRGRGMVVRQELRTVENTYWGIKANQKVAVTFVYLGRCLEWEKRLPAETRRKVVPRHNAENPSVLRASGPYQNFPHFSTATLRYTPQQANLVANLAGWVVHQNRDIFEQALGNGWNIRDTMLLRGSGLDAQLE